MALGDSTQTPGSVTSSAPQKVPDGESMYASWGIAQDSEGNNVGSLYNGYTFPLGDESFNFSMYQFFTPILVELESAFLDIAVNCYGLVGSLFNPRRAKRFLNQITRDADRVSDAYPGIDTDSKGFPTITLVDTPEWTAEQGRSPQSYESRSANAAGSRAEKGAMDAAGLA